MAHNPLPLFFNFFWLTTTLDIKWFSNRKAFAKNHPFSKSVNNISFSQQSFIIWEPTASRYFFFQMFQKDYDASRHPKHFSNKSSDFEKYKKLHFFQQFYHFGEKHLKRFIEIFQLTTTFYTKHFSKRKVFQKNCWFLQKTKKLNLYVHFFILQQNAKTIKQSSIFYVALHRMFLQQNIFSKKSPVLKRNCTAAGTALCFQLIFLLPSSRMT